MSLPLGLCRGGLALGSWCCVLCQKDLALWEVPRDEGGCRDGNKAEDRTYLRAGGRAAVPLLIWLRLSQLSGLQLAQSIFKV